MKKLWKIISILLVFCCLISLLVACGGAPIDLGEAVEKEIIDAFVDVHSQDSHPVAEEEISLRCYGAFDGVYVFLVDVSSWAYILPGATEVIADIEFVYERGQELTVYTNGAFYSLLDAYKDSILSRQELKAVQRNYRSDHKYLY